jgi:hypothetical protein
MPIVNGTEFENVTEEDRQCLRELVETGQVHEISDEMRAFIEAEMPDLIPKLPPRMRQ